MKKLGRWLAALMAAVLLVAPITARAEDYLLRDDVTYDNEFFYTDHTLLYRYHLVRPHYTSSVRLPGLGAINEWLELYYDALVSQLEHELGDLSLGQKQKEGREYRPWEFEAAASATYVARGAISIVIHHTTKVIRPGSLGDSDEFYDSFVFDPESGEILDPEQVLTWTRDDIASFVYSEISARISQEPDGFYENAAALLDSGGVEFRYFLTGDGICFFVNPGEISPHDIVVSIDYAKRPDIFRKGVAIQ